MTLPAEFLLPQEYQLTSLSNDVGERSKRALLSLDGLSCADALGENFFRPKSKDDLINRVLPDGPWKYTDDTAMALAIVEVLSRHGTVDREDLAFTFARRYKANVYRGYGPTAHEILAELAYAHWSTVAAKPFNGQGSCGNGSAMRVAPLGAYFADDYEHCWHEAVRSAQPTHAHPEAHAGAIAIAVAAAFACRLKVGKVAREEFFPTLLKYTPMSVVKDGIMRAEKTPLTTLPRMAAVALGTGSRVICQDTVPYAVWCMAKNFDSYEEGVWDAIACLGDIDTMAAIVGGVVVLSSKTPVPAAWLERREAFAEF